MTTAHSSKTEEKDTEEFTGGKGEGAGGELKTTEDFRAWHQRMKREEEERRKQFTKQLKKINSLSVRYLEEAYSGDDFALYQRSAERDAIDTTRAEKLVSLLESVRCSEDFIEDIRDISVRST